MKRKSILLIKTFIAIGLIVFLFNNNRAAFEDALKVFTPAFLPFLAISACCFLASIFMLALRQMLFLEELEIDSSVKDMFKFAYGGTFANMFLPAGAGYDMLRILHFKTHASLAPVMGWILADKVIGLAGLAALGALTVNAGLVFNGNFDAHAISADIAIAAAGLAGAGLVFSQRGKSLLKAALRKIPWLLDNEKIFSFLDTLKGYSDERRKMLEALLLASVSHLFAVMAVGALGYALGGWAVALSMLFFAPIVMLSSAVPVSPGNLGWTEAVAAGVGYVFGSKESLTVFILWRIVCMATSLGGVFFVIGLVKEKKVA